jgi:hypothetical protein
MNYTAFMRLFMSVYAVSMSFLTNCNHPMQGAQLAICNLQPPATSQCSQMKANPTNGNQFADKPPL